MPFSNKKAQGLPINVIIIAALALIVLFALVIIFTNQTGKTVSTLQSCSGIGARCAEPSKPCEDTEVEKTDAKCAKDNQKCCLKVFDKK